MLRSLQEKKVKMMLMRATMEALASWDKPSGPIRTTIPALLDSERPMGIIRDAVVRGNLGNVHDVMQSMGAFGGPGHRCDDSLSQVSVAGGGAVIADSGTTTGAAAIDTYADVDCQILRIGAYFHFRIMVSVRDMSYVASISSLLQSFNGLCSKVAATTATPAANKNVSSSLCSVPQEVAVVRGNLWSVHDVMRSMGAFGEPGHRCDDSPSQVSVTGGGAAVVDSGTTAGAAAIYANINVDCQSLRIGAYLLFRIMAAMRDMSYVVSTSSVLPSFNGVYSEAVAAAATPAGIKNGSSSLCSLPQEVAMVRGNLWSVHDVMRSMGAFGGPGHRSDDSSLWSGAPVVTASTPGKHIGSGSLCSAPQGASFETPDGLVGVLVRGESCLMVNQPNGRTYRVSVWRADAPGICGMKHALAGASATSSTMAYAFGSEIFWRNLRVTMPNTMSENRMKTLLRLSCPISVVMVAQRPLRQLNEPAEPILGTPIHQRVTGPEAPTLGAHSPLAAASTILRDRARTPARLGCPTSVVMITRRSLQRVSEAVVLMLGAYSPLAAAPAMSQWRVSATIHLGCPTNAVTTVQRPIPQVNEPAAPTLGAWPLQRVGEHVVPMLGAYSLLAATPATTTANIGDAARMGTMPRRAARGIPACVTKEGCETRDIPRGMFLRNSYSRKINENAGPCIPPSGRQEEVSRSSVLGDRGSLTIPNDQMMFYSAAPSASCSFAAVLEPGVLARSGPAENAHLPSMGCDKISDREVLLQHESAPLSPRSGAASPLRDSVVRERAAFARSMVADAVTTAVKNIVASREKRCVHALGTRGIHAVNKLAKPVDLNDGEGIRKQFASGAPVTIERAGCVRLLHKATEASSGPETQALLEVGVDPNVLGRATSLSPPHIAAERGFDEIVRMLLGVDADYQAVDADRGSAIVKAALGGHHNAVGFILEAANPAVGDNIGDPPLHLAARRGASKTIRRLDRFTGVDLNAANAKKQSALYVAMICGNVESEGVLLDEGASIAVGFGSNFSAFYLSVRLVRRDCLVAMISKRVSINLDGEDTSRPLYRALKRVQAATALMLLQHRTSALKKDGYDDTILPLASDAGSVKPLAEFGALGNGRNAQNFTPLHSAVISKKWDVVEALLSVDGRVDIDAKTDEGMTALHYAVKGHNKLGHPHFAHKEEDLRAIETLVRHGADTRARNRQGGTALHMAARRNLLDVVNILLRNREHAVCAVDKSDPSPRRTSDAGLLPVPPKPPAAGSRKRNRKKKSKAKHLRSAEHGEGCQAANVSSAPRNSCVNSCNDLGESPLHVAASVGNVEVVQALLECGGGVEATDGGGTTPLHVAAARSRHDIVLALLKARAPVGQANKEGKTALHIACDLGGKFCDATIGALLEHGASTARKDEGGCTPLHVAILSLKYDEVSATADPRDKPCSVSEATVGSQDKRRSVSETDSRKKSTLPSASVNKSCEEVVELLVAHGAPVGALDHTGKSPLRLACERGHVGVARVLLRAGASPELRGEEGVNPLHTACSRGEAEMVKLLLDAGALPGHCSNSKGVSPLHVAAECGHLGAVNALLPRLNKRQINMEDGLRKTPLIVAVERRDVGIVDAVS